MKNHLLRHATVIAIATLLSGLIAILSLSAQPQGGNDNRVVWSSAIDTERDEGGENGYRALDFGSIDSSIIEAGRFHYEIEYVMWEEFEHHVAIRFDGCLQPSQLVRLRLGEATFSDPDYIRYGDQECREDESHTQILQFHDVLPNPLPPGNRIAIELEIDTSINGNLASTVHPAGPGGATSSTWSTYINSVDEPGDDEYGYEYNDFGRIGERTFVHAGHTFYIDYIKWEDAYDDVQVKLLDCLAPSELVSITIGSRTFSNPDYISYSDSLCRNNRTYNQLFKFRNVASNPLPGGTRVNVTFNLNTVPEPTPTFTPTTTPTFTPTPTRTHTPTPTPQTGDPHFWSTYITSAEGPRGDEYGYVSNMFGQIDEDDFTHNEVVHNIMRISWNLQHMSLQIALYNCLMASEIASIEIATDNSNSSHIFRFSDILPLYTDAICLDNPDWGQIFASFFAESNPLPAGARLKVTFNFASDETDSPDLAPPSRVLANGYSPVNAKAKIGWTTVEGASSYDIQYRKECFPTRTEIEGAESLQNSYTSDPGFEPMACPGQAAKFRWKSIKKPVIGVNESILEHEITDLDLDGIYRIRVRAVSDIVTSDWSEPVLAYVSRTRPDVNFNLPFPTFAHWNPLDTDETDGHASAPIYNYVICNPIADADDVNNTNLPTISTQRAQDLRYGISSWHELTMWKGFWKNGDDSLIRIEEIETTCGITGNTKANNVSVNEVKVLEESDLRMACGIDYGNINGCSLAREIGAIHVQNENAKIADIVPVTSADIYVSINETVRSTDDACSGTIYVAAHEAGHALGLQGDISIAENHSGVESSIMRVSGILRTNRFCTPRYYDIAALTAVYQGRFTVDIQE